MSYQPNGVLGAQQLHHEVQVLLLLPLGLAGGLGRGGFGRGRLLCGQQPCSSLDHDEALPAGQEGPEHPGHPQSAPRGGRLCPHPTPVSPTPRIWNPLSPSLQLATSGSIFLLQIGRQFLGEM